MKKLAASHCPLVQQGHTSNQFPIRHDQPELVPQEAGQLPACTLDFRSAQLSFPKSVHSSYPASSGRHDPTITSAEDRPPVQAGRRQHEKATAAQDRAQCPSPTHWWRFLWRQSLPRGSLIPEPRSPDGSWSFASPRTGSAARCPGSALPTVLT